MGNADLDRCENCQYKKDYGNPVYGYSAENSLAKCYILITECPQREWDMYMTKIKQEPENL